VRPDGQRRGGNGALFPGQGALREDAGSGIGHMCMVIDMSGSIYASQTCGRMISPSGPIKS
jgi:hypothetical protein